MLPFKKVKYKNSVNDKKNNKNVYCFQIFSFTITQNNYGLKKMSIIINNYRENESVHFSPLKELSKYYNNYVILLWV